jgi:hypothetical protein
VSTPVSPDVQRYLLGTRTAVGRPAFEAFLREQHAKAVRVAIYGANTEQREIHSGRAQVWTEMLDLFSGSP